MKAGKLNFLFILILLVNSNCNSQEHSIVVDNSKRIFSIVVPSDYDATINVPLVLVLHGYTNEVRSLGTYTGFNELAEKAGFIAVFPEGTQIDNGYYVWNAGGIYEEWTHGAKDVTFVDSVISFMLKNYAIDKQKVFIAGHSNGSMMAYRLAAELSDKIAAVACVAGPMLDEKVKPANPVAIMHIHGDADLVIPHTGAISYGFKLEAVDEVMKKWIEWDSCSAVPSVLTYNPMVTALQWKGKAEVRLYLLHGFGHDWPSEERGGWPATEYIWNFFKSTSKK